MLTDFLERAVSRLQADERLTGVDILHEENQTIAEIIRKALGPGLGTMIIVKFADLSSSSPDAPGPHLDRVELNITAAENPQMNRGKNRLTALQLAECAATWMHWPNHPEDTLLQELQTTCYRISSAKEGPLLLWTAQFRTSLSLLPSNNPPQE